MSTETTVAKKTENPVIAMFKSDQTKERFAQILDKAAPAFVSSVLAMATQNESLARCSPITVFTAAMTAASLNLQVSPTLGQAYIIPYGTAATFQIGYKGLRQLCLRSGLFKRIKAVEVYEGQIVKADPLHGYKFDFSKPAVGSPIGYVAFIKLHDGFTDEVYWTIDKVKAHKQRFSPAKSGPWTTDFDKMACKTVLKQVLNGAPMSIEMQRAIAMDGAVIKNPDTGEVEFTQAEEVTDSATEASEMLAVLEANEPAFPADEYKMLKGILTANDTTSFPKVQAALDRVIGA